MDLNTDLVLYFFFLLAIVLIILSSIIHGSVSGSMDDTKVKNAKNSSVGILVIGLIFLFMSGIPIAYKLYESFAGKSSAYYYY